MPDSTENQPAVVDALLEAIQEGGDIEAAFEAVNAAGEGEAAVDQLGTALQDSQNISVQARSSIITLLFMFGDPSAVESLGAALTGDPDAGVRRDALGTLERLDPCASLLFFQAALADEDNSIQQAALVSLGIAVRACVSNYQEAGDAQKQAAQQRISQLNIENLESLLNREVLNRDESLISKAAADALGIVGGSEALIALCKFLENELIRQSQIETAGGQSDEERVRENEQAALRADITWNVVIALREIGEPEAVPCLDATLRHNVNDQVRQVTANLLGRLAFPSGIEPLFQAALLDQSAKVRHTARNALKRIPEWQEKVKELLSALDASSLQRGQLDALVLVETICPSEEELAGNEHLLTDFLIAQSLDLINNERLLSLCASLVIASANGSLTLAGERIDDFGKKNDLPEERLRPLRVEIGGSKALSPLLTQLEKNLEIYFQEPIKQLNGDTQHVWRQTIRIAQIGFALRALMSVSLFIIGAYMVIASFQYFLRGELNTDAFFGPGVAFVAGLGTMLTMVYTGPLRDIRKSVSDVGAADAAFMAYIHRLLQVSHTFSYLYLEGRASFDELEKAGKLIKATLRETVKIIRSEADREEE